MYPGESVSIVSSLSAQASWAPRDCHHHLPPTRLGIKALHSEPHPRSTQPDTPTIQSQPAPTAWILTKGIMDKLRAQANGCWRWSVSIFPNSEQWQRVSLYPSYPASHLWISKLSATASAPGLHACHPDSHALILWTCKQALRNVFFYKLAQSWCLFPSPEQ